MDISNTNDDCEIISGACGCSSHLLGLPLTQILQMVSIFLFAAFQIHRISRLESRADAIVKLLLKE